jgi:hypothetical protein
VGEDRIIERIPLDRDGKRVFVKDRKQSNDDSSES